MAGHKKVTTVAIIQQNI